MYYICCKNIHFQGLSRFKFGFNLIQVASITGRGTRGCPLVLPKPFPYKEKKIHWYHKYLDSTMVRIGNENAKIIVVEGPIGVGKSAFCEVLAEQLDMKFIPQPTMDQLYVLPSGYDLRQHDHELPKEIQSYDHKNFCVNPKDPRALKFQFWMLFYKFFQLADAITHLFNTGQGLVLERSYFSDYVFAKAMYKNKFLSPEGMKFYLSTLKNTATFLLPPHLIIYLDIPVPVVQERIRTRNLSYEQNSPALTKEYLQDLETYWKEDYLKKAVENSEILVYNWIDGGDVDVVIDDIEKIDFDVLRRDRRFMQWRLTRKHLFQTRQFFTNERENFAGYFVQEMWKVPEFDIPTYKLMELDRIMRKIPECKYDAGYNYLVGDKIFNILFKSDVVNHGHLKQHLAYRPKVLTEP